MSLVRPAALGLLLSAALAACSGEPAGTSAASSSGEPASTLGRGCSNDMQCGTGLRCDLNQRQGMCVRPCLGLGDCPEGFACTAAECRPSCTQDAQCRILDGHTCDTAAGLCTGPCPTMGCGGTASSGSSTGSSGASSVSGTSTTGSSSSGGSSTMGASTSSSAGGTSASSTAGSLSSSSAAASTASSTASSTSSTTSASSSSGGVPGWTCMAEQHGDGVCDCGCGTADPDCGGNGCGVSGCVAAACEFCHQAGNYDAICGAAANPPAPTWTCAPALQSDNRCDCGCTARDPACDNISSCETPGCRFPTCGACHDRTGATIACNPTAATAGASEARTWNDVAHPGFTGRLMDVLSDGTMVLVDSTRLARRPPGGAWTTFTHALGCADHLFHDSRGRIFISCSGFSNGNGATQPTLWQVDGNALIPERAGTSVVGDDDADWATDRDMAGNTYVLMTQHSDPRCGGSLLLTRPAAVDALDDPTQRQALWTTTCLGDFLETTFSFETVRQGEFNGGRNGRDLWVYLDSCNSTFCDPPSFRRLVDGIKRFEYGLRITGEDTRYRTYPTDHVLRLDAAGNAHVVWYTVPTTNDPHVRVAHSQYSPVTEAWTTTVLLEAPATDYTLSVLVGLAINPVTQEPHAAVKVEQSLQCSSASVWRRTGGVWRRSDAPGLCGAGTSLIGIYPQVVVNAQGRTFINLNSASSPRILHD